MRISATRLRLAAGLSLMVCAVDCGSRGLPESLHHDAGSDAGAVTGEICGPACGGTDMDEDGHVPPPCGDDCDDTDARIRPGAAELEGDGVDTDCDGSDGVDRDGDGHAPFAAGGDDCDDTLATVWPGANDGEGWRVESAHVAFGVSTLSLDRWSRPHAAIGGYAEHGECEGGGDSSPGLAVYSWSSSGWARDVVHEGGCLFPPRELVVRGSNLYVAYAAGDGPAVDREVMVGYRRADGWAVWGIGRSGGAPSAVADDCGRLTVACEAPLSEGEALKVGGAEPGSVAVTVDSAAVFDPRLARSPNGSLWVVYGVEQPWAPNAETDSEVRVATDESGAWELETVEVPPCTRCLYRLDIAVDHAGVPHIAYGTRQGLRYSRRVDGVWQTQTIDEWRQVGRERGTGSGRVTVKVDASGSVHIAHLAVDLDEDPVYRRVRYSTNRSGDWTTESVGPGTTGSMDEAGWPTMDVDANGQVQIAWFSAGDEEGTPLGGYLGGRHAILSLPSDGIDQNCDGVDGVDADGDGRASRQTGGDDSDDSDPAQ